MKSKKTPKVVLSVRIDKKLKDKIKKRKLDVEKTLAWYLEFNLRVQNHEIK